ncbi:hypothetical protein MY4038_010364, partial [Beauveria bassiana]
MDQNAGTGREAEHGYSEKAKARKSGPSLLRKSEELADKANVFAAAIYWEPTHKCHRIAARLPEGETLPDLNRLVADALAGRLPEPLAQPKKKKVPSGRRAHAAGASRRTAKTQQVQQPLRRSARMHQTRGSDAMGDDVYTFRGDSEGAGGAEATNGGSSGSGSRCPGSDFGSHRGFDSVLERAPVGSDHEGSVRRQSDLGCAAKPGGGAGGAAHCSPPGSMETSTVEGATQVFEQSAEAMDLLHGSFYNDLGVDMTVTEVVAAHSPVAIARRDDASAAALPQPEHQPVSTHASLPRTGMAASGAWRRMAQDALGTVNLLLASDPRSMQAELGML